MDVTWALCTGRTVLDAAPVAAEGIDVLALDAAGDLVGIDLGTGAQRVLCQVPLPEIGEPDPRSAFTRERARLHATSDGTLVAVVHDTGTTGVVVEVATGRVTMRLNAADYHARTVAFSAAFARLADRWVLAHRSEWNRLDVVDALTGEQLTARPSPIYDADSSRPEHYLDYFHAGLAVSETGQWIADAGWVWQPAAVLRIWSLREWLDHNPWESEDGPSVRDQWVGDDWDLPMVWLPGEVLAAVRRGDWDQEEFEESRDLHLLLIDPSTSDRASDRRIALERLPTGVFADGRLVIVADEHGTAAWNPVTLAEEWRWPDVAVDLIDGRGRRAVQLLGDSIMVRALP